VSTGRIVIGGMMEREGVCLVEVLGFDWCPGKACGILGKFGRADISLSYLSIGNGPEGDKNMSFCVNTARLAASRQLITEIEAEFGPTRVEVRGPMTILTLYGPHFAERTNVASEVFSALCVDGINAQTVCSSVNSISVVVDTLDRDRTVECLRQKFEWPE
jgi:aspartokinase